MVTPYKLEMKAHALQLLLTSTLTQHDLGMANITIIQGHLALNKVSMKQDKYEHLTRTQQHMKEDQDKITVNPMDKDLDPAVVSILRSLHYALTLKLTSTINYIISGME